MDIRDGFCGLVGNTPLVRLRRASEETGCEILGKAEFLNPGGSVEDRAALGIITDAEERGLLKPGGVVVEGIAGNTGIGLALVGNVRGSHLMGCIECVADKATKAKFDEGVDVGKRVDRHCQARGLILRPLGGLCVFSPPLTINREQIDRMVDIMAESVEATMVDLRSEGLWNG